MKQGKTKGYQNYGKKLVGVMLAAGLLLAGCSASSTTNQTAETTSSAPVAEAESNEQETVYPFIFTDDNGREVTLEKKPERGVPLTLSTLYLFNEFGGDAVGAPDESKNSPAPSHVREDLVRLGSMNAIDLEKFMTLEPDFVMVQSINAKILPALDQNKINYAQFNIKTYEEVKEAILLMGKINNDNKFAKEAVENLEKRVADIQAKVPQEDKKKAAIVYLTSKEVQLKLPSSIAGNVASLLGIQNIADGLVPENMGSENVPFDLERIVQEDPDIIFVTSMIGADLNPEDVLKKHMENSSAWNAIPAVKEGRVYYLPQKNFLFNPMDHFDESMKIMAEYVWPEQFQ